MSATFIIGNGLSRKPIDLTKLKGTTVGCNALYREFTPDYLSVVDRRMLEEIVESPLFFKNKVLCYNSLVKDWPDKKFYSLNIPPVIDIRVSGMDSGYNAFKHVFYNHKVSKIYLLGFDFIYSTKDNKLNNIYAGTSNYINTPRKLEIKSNLHKNIIHYCTERKRTKFIRVINPEISYTWDQKDLKFPRNYTEITVEEFKKDHGC